MGNETIERARALLADASPELRRARYKIELKEIKKKERRVLNRIGWIDSIAAKKESGLKCGDVVKLKILGGYALGVFVCCGFYKGQIAFCRAEDYEKIRRDGVARFNNTIEWRWPNTNTHREYKKLRELIEGGKQ